MMSIVSSSFAAHPKPHHEHSTHKVRHISQERKVKQDGQNCAGCQAYREEIGQLKAEIGRVVASKMLWKSGEMSLGRVKEEFGLGTGRGKGGKTKKVTE